MPPGLSALFLSRHQLIGKIEKVPKTKESPAQKPEPEKTEKTKQSDGNTQTQICTTVREGDSACDNNVFSCAVIIHVVIEVCLGLKSNRSRQIKW